MKSQQSSVLSAIHFPYLSYITCGSPICQKGTKAELSPPRHRPDEKEQLLNYSQAWNLVEVLPQLAMLRWKVIY